MSWDFPTLAKGGRPPHAKVRCGCGRTTRADLFTDLSALAPETRAAWKCGGAEAICDACRETILREKRAKLSDICEGLGAPVDVVEHLRAKESRARGEE